ncbi:MAG TPA: hypothetical protein VKA60_08420 [Blastocatellia bacterium]|nr:hypothetical protein [Blastocatellia bacterium]
MKTIKSLVLTIVLTLSGYAYATAGAQTVNNQAKATPQAACCADHAACSTEGKSGCAEGAACCKEGAACCAQEACCADHAACCAEGAACCQEGAACCTDGASCCAASHQADKVTAKAHKAAHDKSAKDGCCVAGHCQMTASAK